MTRRGKLSRMGELCRILNRRQPLVLSEIAQYMGTSTQHVRNLIAPLVRDGVVVTTSEHVPKIPRKGRVPRAYVLRRDLPDLDVRV